MDLPENHDCLTCALKRVVIEPKVEVADDDCKVFDRIVTMINNTEQMIKTGLPEGTASDADRKAFYSVAIDKQNDAKALLSEWWTNSRKKYGVPITAKFDSFDGIFYNCCAEDGTASLTGEYVAKNPVEKTGV